MVDLKKERRKMMKKGITLETHQVHLYSLFRLPNTRFEKTEEMGKKRTEKVHMSVPPCRELLAPLTTVLLLLLPLMHHLFPFPLLLVVFGTLIEFSAMSYLISLLTSLGGTVASVLAMRIVPQ